MEGLVPPKPMKMEDGYTNVAETWKEWKQELQFYIDATEKTDKSDKIKTSLLLTCIGAKGRELYNTFTFTPATNSLVYKEVLKKFDNHFEPKKNVTFLRYKFFTYQQKDEETFNEYVT